MTKPQARLSSGLFSNILDHPYVLLVLTSLFWGGNMVAGKLAVGQIDPYTLSICRWAGAFLLILPLCRPHLRKDWPLIRKSLPILLLYGAFGYAGFNFLMYVAAHFTSAVNASIEQAMIPGLVMLANFVFFGVRSRPWQVFGVVLTILGVGITATHGDLSRIVTLSLNFGDGLILLACLAYAVHSLALRFRPAIHWTSFLVVTFAAALLVALGFQILFADGLATLGTGLVSATPLGWGIVLFAATFPSILSQFFYARGVTLIGANRASLFINLIPLFGTLLSILILSEPLESYHMITAILVIIGIIMAELSARSAPEVLQGAAKRAGARTSP